MATAGTGLKRPFVCQPAARLRLPELSLSHPGQESGRVRAAHLVAAIL